MFCERFDTQGVKAPVFSFFVRRGEVMSIPKTFRIVGALFLLLSIGQATWAQRANRWVYLGQANVDSLRDYDKIVVGRTSGRFSNIQIRVAGAPIQFQRVVVHYGNGTSEEVTLRDRIPAGGQTRSYRLEWHRPGNQQRRFLV